MNTLVVVFAGILLVATHVSTAYSGVLDYYKSSLYDRMFDACAIDTGLNAIDCECFAVNMEESVKPRRFDHLPLKNQVEIANGAWHECFKDG